MVVVPRCLHLIAWLLSLWYDATKPTGKKILFFYSSHTGRDALGKPIPFRVGVGRMLGVGANEPAVRQQAVGSAAVGPAAKIEDVLGGTPVNVGLE